MKTLTEFAESSRHPEITRAVVRQLGGWNEDTTSSMEDICRHGVGGGFGGFIYYTDTCKFYRKHKQHILSLTEEMATELGEDMLTMIAHFGCLKDMDLTPSDIGEALWSSKGECVDQIQNALAWFAAEEVANAYDNFTS